MLNDDQSFSIDTYLSNKLNQIKNNNSVGIYNPYQSKNISVSPIDFNNLSKFEKGVIKTIAEIYGIISDPDQNISYNTLMDIMERWARDKGSSEKDYLLSLLFPERVKNANIIYPFPIPTYTYVQKFQFPITPNTNGAFLIQAVCPFMVDSTQTSSNIYINTNAALNGTSIDSVSAHYVPQTITNVVPNQFQAYTLQCAKLSVRYVGRLDIASGYLGGSYFLSVANEAAPDTNASLFNYIDDSINAVIVDKSEGLNVVYFPPDYSYLNFFQVNRDNVASNTMSTNVRLCIYGNSLPGPNIDGGVNNNMNAIMATWVVVWSVLPSPQFADLLPLNYDIQVDNKPFTDTAKFIPASGLTTFKNTEESEIHKMLTTLPKNVIDNAIKDLGPMDSRNNGLKKKSILDVLKPLLSPNPRNMIYWDKDELVDLLQYIKEDKLKNTDMMNNLIAGNRLNN